MLKSEKLCKYFGGVHALENVTFEVDAGLVTSLIGPNGAGKTTLFNVLSRIMSPTKGQIIFNGTDITNWPPHRVAALGIGRTFQNVRLFYNLNVIENIIAAHFCRTRSSFLESVFFLPRGRRERQQTQEVAEELLKWVGIHEYRFHMPRELPYGYQRRLEIARALITEPILLLLDEPSAGMSQQEARELMELIGRLKERGYTVFLIEHNMQLVMSISDKVIVLSFGEKIAEGTVKEVQNDPNVIQAYLGVEA